MSARQRMTLSNTIINIFLIIIVVLSFGTLSGPDKELHFFERLFSLMNRFFPPDFSILPELVEALIATLRIAIASTALATLISLPLAFLASERFSPRWLRSISLTLQATIRTIPSLIWALLAVVLLGAHELAGVIALMFYSIGYLAKFFADAVDTSPIEQAQMLRLNGAHPIQAFQYGLLPSLAPLLQRHILWMFEYNIRSASIIGYVGAGGIGTQLHIYQEYGQWDRFATVLLVILILVLLLEFISRWRSANRSI